MAALSTCRLSHLVNTLPRRVQSHISRNARGGFAKRVGGLPGGRFYVAASIAAIVLATVAGAFGTGNMPALRRLLFWTLVIGVNTTAWACWFAWRVRRPADWWRAAALGAIVINLPLPFEIAAASRIAGGSMGTGWPLIWVYAALVSLALLLVIIVAMPVTTRAEDKADFTKGALWRAGARQPEDIVALCAEDHYCRVLLAKGASMLVHGRFSDLLDELGDADGLVVRRGNWIAARAVRAIERQGRRWVVIMDGRSVPVAASCVGSLRDRGWL